ncbi:V-type ATP synthase subunit D [Synechococcus sp. PCC 7336]|uniref:V-type ATP synthase subunit D n=1 Tax=Synechococcus sp. PCC 7336 TaxID=195250 RepID=UPI000348A5A2|nr:V-type ATP synthase subunit D [Synechococcus sp. PCC 7336]
MARLALNKSSLTKQKRQLKTFNDYLPSLDLKRRQLVAEQAKARKLLIEGRAQLAEIEPIVAQKLPMLGNRGIELAQLVKATNVRVSRENVVGTQLPKLDAVDIEVRNYALLGKPQWIDHLVDFLKVAIELELQMQVATKRLELLEEAVRTITQRVNLFDKVLIPRTRKNIKKIQIYLSDTERAAVVIAKIAKRKKGAAS